MTLLRWDWQWPRVYRAIKLAHILERTQAFCDTGIFVVFLRSRHVLRCPSGLLADSCASVQPRNQIKNQRENSWRTTFPDNHGKIQTRFQTCMAPGLSHGRAGLLVLLSVSTCLTTSQHSTNKAKTQESLKQISVFAPKKRSTVCATMTRTSWCKETPWTSAL